jgi:hypothetical protein
MIIYELTRRSSEEISLKDQIFSEISPEYNWSPDGDWILLMNQGIVGLIESKERSYYSIYPPEPGCTQAIWSRV